MRILPAYAKVNLCLAVRGRREDGHHELDAVSVMIDWHDLVGVALKAAPATAVSLQVTAADPAALAAVPTDAGNLAVRALELLAESAGPFAARVWLEKRIPAGAGLGGGSADAVAALRLGAAGLADLKRPLPAGAVESSAAALGSDLPMLLAGGVQRVRGRGERLDGLGSANLHLAVAMTVPSATAAVYAAVEPFDMDDSARIDRVAAAVCGGARPDDDDLGSGLEDPACRISPLLDQRLTALRAALPVARWHLTGSGGAAFALATSAAHAAELAQAATRCGFPGRACRTLDCWNT